MQLEQEVLGLLSVGFSIVIMSLCTQSVLQLLTTSSGRNIWLVSK